MQRIEIDESQHTERFERQSLQPNVAKVECNGFGTSMEDDDGTDDTQYHSNGAGPSAGSSAIHVTAVTTPSYVLVARNRCRKRQLLPFLFRGQRSTSHQSVGCPIDRATEYDTALNPIPYRSSGLLNVQAAHLDHPSLYFYEQEAQKDHSESTGNVSNASPDVSSVTVSMSCPLSSNAGAANDVMLTEEVLTEEIQSPTFCGNESDSNDFCSHESMEMSDDDKTGPCIDQTTEMYSPPVDVFTALETLSNRGRCTSLAVPISDNAVRVYRLSSIRPECDIRYFRCSRCESINKHSKIKRRPRIKMHGSQVVGSAFPRHHSTCKPMPLSQYRARQLDLSCRADVRDGVTDPKEAWSQGRTLAKSLDLSDGVVDVESAEDEQTVLNNFPDWKKARKAYAQIRRVRTVSPPQHYSHPTLSSDKLEEKNRISSSAKELLRESRDSAKSSPALSTVGNNQVNNDGRNVGDSETVSQCSVIKTLSNRGRYTSLAIRVSDDAVRVYRLSSSREESGTNYYRCSRCECLNKKSDVKFKPRVKTQNGRIIGDAFPSHHHDCQPLPLPKYQAQQLDYSCRADVRDGLAEPKQAWSRGHDIALQKWAAAEESAISKEVIDNFPDWSHVRKAYSRIRRQRHERDSFGHGRTYSCHDE